MQNKKGDLRVWWIPQVPMKPFYYPISTIKEAKMLLDVLALYDTFQYKNRIKPDYSNAGGLQEWDEDNYDPANDEEGDGSCWTDWYNAEGYGIDEVDDNGEAI